MAAGESVVAATGEGNVLAAPREGGAPAPAFGRLRLNNRNTPTSARSRPAAAPAPISMAFGLFQSGSSHLGMRGSSITRFGAAALGASMFRVASNGRLSTTI